MFGIDKKARRKFRKKQARREKREFIISLFAGVFGILVLIYMWIEAKVEEDEAKEEKIQGQNNEEDED